ncbi:HTH-type transcriptional regulator YesS [compost metagenome]
MTIGNLELLLLDWVKQIAEVIEEKKDRRDVITSFVMEYVNEHLADEIYLDTLADKLKISSGYLSTYFKEKTGINVVEYINETRVRKATDLLVESQLKIQDVAEAVGYRNITSFNRMFKKYTGLNPSDYRKSRDSHSSGTV